MITLISATICLIAKNMRLHLNRCFLYRWKSLNVAAKVAYNVRPYVTSNDASIVIFNITCSTSSNNASNDAANVTSDIAYKNCI